MTKIEHNGEWFDWLHTQYRQLDVVHNNSGSIRAGDLIQVRNLMRPADKSKQWGIVLKIGLRTGCRMYPSFPLTYDLMSKDVFLIVTTGENVDAFILSYLLMSSVITQIAS
jgi:hypothetical protein